jgi:branched-subunit amino acid transport protein
VTGGEQAALVALLAATTWGLRAAGPTLLGSRRFAPRPARMIALVAPALLAALVAWQVFGRGEHIVLDARLAGLAAAAAVVAARLPIPFVLLAAAAATAAARLF